MNKNTTEYFGYLAPSHHAAIWGIAVGNGGLATGDPTDADTLPPQADRAAGPTPPRGTPRVMPVIDDMIQEFDGSRSHFFRAFRRETGQTLSLIHI